MRDGTLVYPFSTYSVGVPRSAGRALFFDRHVALPALAIVAGASVVVFAFGHAAIEHGESPAGDRSGSSQGEKRATAVHLSASFQVPNWQLENLQLGRVERPLPATIRIKATQQHAQAARGMTGHLASAIAPRNGPPIPARAFGQNIARSSQTGQPREEISKSPGCTSSCSDDGQPTIVEAAPAVVGISPTPHALASRPTLQSDQSQTAGELIVPAQQPLLADNVSQPSIAQGRLSASDPPNISPSAVAPEMIQDANDAAQPADAAPLSSGGPVANSAAAQPVGAGRANKPVTSADLDVKRHQTVEAVSSHLSSVKRRYDNSANSKGSLIAPDSADQPSGSDVRAAVSLSAIVPGSKVGSTIIVRDDTLVAIKLSELISLFQNHFDRPLFVWLRTSSSASKFVTPETLASAGIRTHFDRAERRLVLSLPDQ